MLEHLASSKQTQLRMLDAEGVASLLPHVFPQEWKNRVEVSIDAYCSISLDWFETFWKWVKNHNLELFANKLVVPILHKTSGLISLMRLQLNSPIICVQKHEVLQKEIRSVFSKLDVKYTEVRFLKHKMLMSYLKSLSPDDVLMAIKFGVPSNVIFSEPEARAFQKFLMERTKNSDWIYQDIVQVLLSCWQFITAVSGAPKKTTGHTHHGAF